MTDLFDPSPRSTKRRKTTIYNKSRSIFDDKENNQTLDLEETRGKLIAEPEGQNHDSAYGSKEDSLLEEDQETAADSSAVTGIGVDGSDSFQDNHIQPLAEDTTGNGSAQTMNPFLSEDEDHETITVQPRSSGRERKRPRRYSISPEIQKAQKPAVNRDAEIVDQKSSKDIHKSRKSNATPRGILTPSRREKGKGPRKSVIFDQDEEEIAQRLGFKDIDTSVDKERSSSKYKVKSTDASIIGSPSTPSTPSKKRKATRFSPQPAEVETNTDLDDILGHSIDEVVDDTVLLDQDEGMSFDSVLEDDPAVIAVKSRILSRLVCHGNTQVLAHLRSQYDALHSLLQATVASGESNSLLLLGARGTGKSQLLETAISDLNSQHPNDFHTVRLNGFFQTDDKIALREIWRQLGREMDVTEMETGDLGGSYADTMTSLLSLLSHPDEFGEITTSNGDAMEVEGRTVRTSKSIVFILDEFDLFTTHPRQTLLYNLFDIAQSKKAPIAVIGCSTRMDVVDCLEKRVKSRFSHRWLHIPSAKLLSDFEEIVRNTLCIEVPDNISSTKILKKDIEARKRWNDYIQSTFLASAPVKDATERVFHTSKSIPEILAALYMPIAKLQLPNSDLPINNQVMEPLLLRQTNKPNLLTLLPSLPTIHLALLIAACRLDTILNLTTLNFNLVYAHYVELISRSKLQVTASGAVAVGASLRQWSRETSVSAWEDLGLYECIVPVTGTVARGGNRDGGSNNGDHAGGEGASVRMWRVDVTLEELNWSVREKWKDNGGARDVLSKWCKEI